MKRVGSYELSEVLGDGGSTTVYRGRDPRFDRPVTLKVLHARLVRDPEALEMFTARAGVQARLSHPHILTVLDFVVDAPAAAAAVVLEHVGGVPLATLIREAGGPLPEESAVAIALQTLSALGHAHDCGVIHRGVKPSNVLVRRAGDGEHALLMDFGAGKAGAEKARGQAEVKLADLPYLSPEQLRTPQAIDVRTDVYSLGATLHEMLTGAPPFVSGSEHELMKLVLDEVPRGLTGVPPGSPLGRLAPVLLRAMAKRPQDRFPDAESFAEALRAAAGGAVPGRPAAVAGAAREQRLSLLEEDVRQLRQGVERALELVEALGERPAAQVVVPPPQVPARVDEALGEHTARLDRLEASVVGLAKPIREVASAVEAVRAGQAASEAREGQRDAALSALAHEVTQLGPDGTRGRSPRAALEAFDVRLQTLEQYATTKAELAGVARNVEKLRAEAEATRTDGAAVRADLEQGRLLRSVVGGIERELGLLRGKVDENEGIRTAMEEILSDLRELRWVEEEVGRLKKAVNGILRES